MPISRTVPTEYQAPLSSFNLRFTETQVAPGARPALPGGAAGLTDEEAVAIAMAHSVVNGQLPPGVQVAARFGMFSDDVLAKGGPGQPMQLMYQNRPAWIVTFFGPGLTVALPGTQAVHHEQNVVVDAATAAYLLGYH